MFMYILSDCFCRNSLLNPLRESSERPEMNKSIALDGTDWDDYDSPMEFDPSLDELDVLGDFGLDDEPIEPELGDFWIDSRAGSE